MELALPYTPLRPFKDEFDTLPSLFYAAAAAVPNQPLVLTRSADPEIGYGSRSYSECSEHVSDLAAAVAALLPTGGRVGILAGTRWAWLMSDIGIMAAKCSVVPLYATLTDDDLKSVVQISGLRAVVVAPDCASRLPGLLDAAPVSSVIFMDDMPADAATLAPLAGALGLRLELAATGTAATVQDETIDSLVRAKADGVLFMTMSTAQRAGRRLRGACQSCTGGYASDSVAQLTDGEPQAAFIEDAVRAIQHSASAPAPAPLTAQPVLAGEATVVFTSGSTGTPKGAVLTHTSFLSVIVSSQTVMTLGAPEFDVWRHFAFLPLAHVYERLCEWLSILQRGQIAYFTTLRNFAVDLEAASPTFVAVVPRVLERIYRNVHSSVGKAPLVARLMFKFSVFAQKSRLAAGLRRSALLDRLVFAKIRNTLGGKLKVIACGSAPLNKTVGEFVELATTAQVTEGYGASETSCLSFALPFHVTDWGTCGAAIPGVQAKLVSRPDVNPAYVVDCDEPAGELCLRGPSIFAGYLGAQSATDDVFDDNGWFKTGDICRLSLPLGNLRIVDRVRAVFKLSQGEYVCANKVESALSAGKFIEHVAIFGSSADSFTVAAIQPNFEELRRAFPGAARTTEAMLRAPDVQRALLADVQAAAKAAELVSYEVPLYLAVSASRWTPESGELTPSFKTRRNPIKKRFESLFDRFYAIARAESGKHDAQASELARAAPRVRLHTTARRGCSAGIAVM